MLPSPTPSRTLPSITQPVTMPPRPPKPEVPWEDTSNPASWLPSMVEEVTSSPSAPQSEMPKRLPSAWQAVMRMPLGGAHSSFSNSRKIPLVPLPVAVQAVTVSRSTRPQPPTPMPMPAPPICSPLSCRPHRSARTPSTTVSWRKSQPKPVAAVSWMYRSLNRPRSTYCGPGEPSRGHHLRALRDRRLGRDDAGVRPAGQGTRPAAGSRGLPGTAPDTRGVTAKRPRWRLGVRSSGW